MNSLFRRAVALLPLALTLLPGASHAADAPACKYANVGNLPLRLVGKSGLPAVQGSINGAPATMLVSTGMMNTTLTDAAVQRFDLNTHLTTRRTQGVRSGSNLATVQLTDFGIGPTHVERVILDVRGDMHPPAEIDAYVAADFLFQADIEFAWAEKTLRFFRPVDCDKDSYLAYWSQDAMLVPVTGNFGRNKNGIFTVELNGVKLDAIIDTGMSRSVVFDRGAVKAGVDADHASNRELASRATDNEGLVPQRRAVFATFTIGNETIRDAELVVARDPNVSGFRPTCCWAPTSCAPTACCLPPASASSTSASWEASRSSGARPIRRRCKPSWRSKAPTPRRGARYNRVLTLPSPAMFTPSSHDVRRFFCEAYRKRLAGEILSPMDAIAADWIAEHPEYDSALADAEEAVNRDYSVEGGQTNPFLHLSMHLSIAEQVQVDQPRGIRDAFNALSARLGAHDAHHQIMECLGQMIWASQRAGTPPDTEAYIECVREGAR